jgi:hypothetical protein
MLGVVKRTYFCNQNRTEDLNTRIYGRQVALSAPQVQFSPRPVPTKYTMLPILDQAPRTQVPLVPRPEFSVSRDFLPGDSAPWCGFSAAINTESILKNMFFANQRCPRAFYVPDSNSDMYGRSYPRQAVPQSSAPQPTGAGVFNTSTRQQVLDHFVAK